MTTTAEQNSKANRLELEQDGSKVEVFGEEGSTKESKEAVILCFHGSGVEAGPDWRALASSLAGKHLVVLFDRGSGNPSPTAHIRVVSDYLNRNGLSGPLIIIAHSYGGLFAKRFLYMHRKKIAGMVLVETGKGGQRSSEEATMLRQSWMGSVPLSVIRGNSLLTQWQSLEKTYASVSNGQESNEVESKRKWLQMCDEEDEKFEKEQLDLSENYHYVHLPYCGHNIIRDAPDVVIAEVEWVLENCCSKDSNWSARRWLSGLARLVR